MRPSRLKQPASTVCSYILLLQLIDKWLVSFVGFLQGHIKDSLRNFLVLFTLKGICCQDTRVVDGRTCASPVSLGIMVSSLQRVNFLLSQMSKVFFSLFFQVFF